MRYPVLALVIWCQYLAPALYAQQLLSGPIQMHTTDTLTQVWLLVKQTQRVEMTVFDTAHTFQQTYTVLTDTAAETTVLLPFHHLQPATTYHYRLVLDTIEQPQGSLRTLQANTQGDFSFLAASCASVSDGIWQKMGIGAKKRPFKSAAQTPADFMLWLGDNFYYRNGEWNDSSRMWRRNVRARTYKYMRELLQTRPNYAIWDDHDCGANNTDGNFVTKHYSLDLFQQFWGNPAYGTATEEGIFHRFSYQDADFFMLDERYNKVHKGSVMSEAQWQWLFDNLKSSTAIFKFVVGGTQFLNQGGIGVELLDNYPPDRERLLQFIADNNIKGIIFISGDRHFAEMYRLSRPNTYDLWDVTTSGINTNFARMMGGNSRKNPLAVPNTKYNGMNYARFSLSGKTGKRQCQVEIFDKKGKVVCTHTWQQAELGY